MRVLEFLEGWGDGLLEVHSTYCAMNQMRVPHEELFTIDSLDLAHRNLETKAAYGLAAVVYLSTNLSVSARARN